MAEFAEPELELELEVVSDSSSSSSSDSEVEMVKITDEVVPLGEVEELAVPAIGGYCPHCGLGISIDLSAIKGDNE
jgi:hypothetical protein